MENGVDCPAMLEVRLMALQQCGEENCGWHAAIHWYCTYLQDICSYRGFNQQLLASALLLGLLELTARCHMFDKHCHCISPLTLAVFFSSL